MAALAVFFIILISVWWEHKFIRLIGFAGLILLAGSLRFQTAIIKNNLQNYYKKDAVVEGVVVEEPDVREDKIYLTIGRLTVDGQKIDDKILASVYPYRNFAYGDKLKLSGKITEPKEFPDFNYRMYLSRFGIDAVMYFPYVDLLQEHQGNPVKSGLLTAKHKFIENLSQVLPEPQNAFLAGLLVGNKRSIPQNLTDAFNTTGTSHIIAISGYNITIIVWAMDLLLRRFGKKTSAVVAILVILSFVVLTGASASVIRAAIMGGLGLLALNIGRIFNVTNALVATAAAMIFINPKILHFDVGFQLSFLALAGLIYLSPILNKALSRLPQALRLPLVATLSAQIFALPILLYNFDQLSLIAPLTNLLVLPLVPLTMLFGFLSGLLGFILPGLSAVFSWPAWILLSYIITAVEWTASIPYASIALHINLIGLYAYYVILAAALIYFSRQKSAGNLSPLPQEELLYKAAEFR